MVYIINYSLKINRANPRDVALQFDANINKFIL